MKKVDAHEIQNFLITNAGYSYVGILYFLEVEFGPNLASVWVQDCEKLETLRLSGTSPSSLYRWKFHVSYSSNFEQVFY